MVFIWKFGKLTQYFCIKTINFELFIYYEGFYVHASHVTA